MDIFLLLFTNLIPLYLLIGAGYFAGRYMNADRQTLANITIFIFVPVVNFGFITHLDLKFSYLLLPVLAYVLQFCIAFMFLKIGRIVYGDSRANLLSLCSAMANVGYFGLPLALLLAEESWIGVYMFMLLGFVLFEGTAGYYLAARGNFTVKDSLIKLAKFPTIYATILGVIVNQIGWHMPPLFETYWGYFKGAYVLLGMMIIGVALAHSKKIVIAPKFLALSFLGKFVVWPLAVFGLIWLDRSVFHVFEEEVHKLFFVISIVPPAANVAAFASQLDLRPEKAASTILIGTIFALFFIPAALILARFY